MHLSEQLLAILGHCHEQHLLIEEPGFGVLVLRTADAVASLERDHFFFLFFFRRRALFQAIAGFSPVIIISIPAPAAPTSADGGIGCGKGLISAHARRTFFFPISGPLCDSGTLTSRTFLVPLIGDIWSPIMGT